MPTLLPLTPDELLSTTRAVRKRLDLTRPVERDVLEACLRLAQQAPSGSNKQGWQFVVVTDPAKRAALGELYRRGGESYWARQALEPEPEDPAAQAAAARLRASARYLADHMGEVPVHIIPCISGRPDGAMANVQAPFWGSLLPAVWSFMLAARARGLGTAWTTFHLKFEAEAAELLGIPYGDVTQAALIPVAYTVGTDFRPGPRQPLTDIVHWDQW